MKPSSSSSSRHGSGGSKDDDREFDSHGSKTPGANHSFHHSYGALPKLRNQRLSPDILEAFSCKEKNPPGLVAQDEMGGKTSGPATKRARGMTSSRKSNLNTRSNKTSDDSAPTLSMLKQSGQLSSETPPAGLAPHTFGNALNPSSSMAMKMVDTLSEETEAVAAAGGTSEVVSTKTPLVGIPGPSTKPSVPPTANVTATGNAASTSISAAGAQVPPQTLEQLLERQWEPDSQFLMEQAQHLDIAELLSCLYQLKLENNALEEHVQSRIQRRDQLTAISARLSVPLGSSSTLTSLGGGTGAEAGAGTGPSANSDHNGYAMNPGAPSPNVQSSSCDERQLEMDTDC